MFVDKFFISHVGFLLMLLGLSLMISVSTKYSSSVNQGILITAIIVAILTGIVYFSSTESLIKMSNWIKPLMWILISAILVEIAFILFSGNSMNQWAYKIIAISIIVLFGFFVLSDTSRLFLESQNLTCATQSCINYPLKSSNLILDYINIFVNSINFQN